MIALVNLESRRLLVMLPFVGIMMAFGLLPMILMDGEAPVGIGFLAMGAIVLVGRLFPSGTADDRANALIGTLPAVRRKVIGARYLLSLAIILAAMLTIAVILPDVAMAERIGITTAIALIPVLHLTAIGPLSSKGGLGPLVPAVAAAIPFLLLMVGMLFVPESTQQAVFVTVMEKPALFGGITALIVAVLLVASFTASAQLFQRRDL